MGLMDMFSVKDIRSFGTGFLGAKVEAMQESARVAADEKKFNDQLKANQISELEIYEKKKSIDADIIAERDDELRKKRKNFLASYYTVDLDYIDRFVPSYALDDDDMMKLWMSDQEEYYGVKDWSTRTINFGNGIGMTVPEWQMSTKTNRFSKKNSVDNMKKSANVPDAIADVVTNNKKEKQKIEYLGSELFFGKAKHALSEGLRLINNQGNIIYAYQKEQTLGEKDWAPEYYTLQENNNGDIMPMLLQNPADWFDINKERGQMLMKKHHPLTLSESEVQYMVWDPRLKTHNRVTGTIIESTDGSKQTIIDGGDPVWLNSIGLPGVYYEAPPSAQRKINNWSFDAGEFEKITGLELRPYDATVYWDSKKINVPSSLISKPNDARKLMEAGMMSAGYRPNDDFKSMEVSWLSGTVEFTAFEDPSKNEAAEVLGTVIIDAVSDLESKQNLIGQSMIGDDISDYKISPEVMVALNLQSDNPANISQYQYVQRIGEFYKSIRNELGVSYLNKLNSFGDDSDARSKFLEREGISTELFSQSNELLAQSLTQNNLKTINTFDGILDLRNTINRLTAEKLEEIKLNDQKIIDTYFPPNISTLGNFVDEYITDYSGGTNSKKQLGDLLVAINDLTGGNEEHIAIFDVAIQNYLDTKDVTDSSFDTKSKFEIKKEDKELSEQEEIDLFENINMPPDYRATSPGAQAVESIFKGEQTKDMLNNNEILWVENNAENWNKIIALANKEKPTITHTMSEPTLANKIGSKQIETEAYKKWKAKYWEYLKADGLAQELIRKHTVQQ